MKHVYKTEEIAHLWMHKTQSDARNPQGNFYFDGDTIYSYGGHFPIARHVTNAKGEPGILFTTRGYSSTTSKHIHEVRCAIHGNGVPVLYVFRPSAPSNIDLREFDKDIADKQKQCFGPTGRFRSSVWSELGTLIDRANEYAAFFGHTQRWTLPENTDAIKATIAADNARKAKLEKTLERKRKIAEKKRAKEAQELLARWVAGENIDTYRFEHDVPVALRVVGEEIETSKGASFPIDHARRGVQFVRAVVASGTEYVRNGHTFHLGHYKIDSVEPDGTVHAGCHVVAFSEVERIAGQLGM